MNQSDWDDLVAERISIILMNGVNEWEAQKMAFKDTVFRFGPRPADYVTTNKAIPPGGNTTGWLRWHGSYETMPPSDQDSLKR